MSTATCTPELFTNLIGTFIADSDMGIGAVIGSLMFNMLGVSAVASFATRSVCLLQIYFVNYVIFLQSSSLCYFYYSYLCG